MRIARQLDEIGRLSSPSLLTIGNFDGVHCAHRRLLERLVRRADAQKALATVLTFDPHPLKIVAPDKAPLLILPLEEKIRLMDQIGIGMMVILPFTAELARLSPEAFVEQIVVERLQAQQVHLGPNFRFGHRQQGDTKLLAQLAERFGFRVEILPMMEIRGRRVSSTCIRGLVSSGQVAPAGRLLGRPFALHGKVIAGEGVGRKQTVPTLNLQPRQELLPQAGVYITRTRPASGSDRYSSLTNVGHRPTFGDHPLSIETFLLDPPEAVPEAIDEAVNFAQIEVEFLYRLRDEKKFPDPSALKRQIALDTQRAKKYFRLLEKVRPRHLSPTHR